MDQIISAKIAKLFTRRFVKNRDVAVRKMRILRIFVSIGMSLNPELNPPPRMTNKDDGGATLGSVVMWWVKISKREALNLVCLLCPVQYQIVERPARAKDHTGRDR